MTAPIDTPDVPVDDVVEPIARDPNELPTGWRGPILPVNTASGDGRLFTLDGEEVPTRPLPLAFQAQTQLAEGHDTAIVVGLITRTWLQDGHVWAEGPFDLADEDAAKWAGKLGRGMAGWVSIDLSDTRVVEVPLDEDGNEIPAEVLDAANDALEAWKPGMPEPELPVVADVLLRVDKWRVMAATLVSSPAFETARVEPVFGEEFTSTPAVPALVAAAETEHTGAMVALVPADPGPLAVDGGEAPEQLHLTLAYLGEAIEWTPEAQETLRAAVAGLASAPVDSDVFGHARFNPTGDEPCVVYLVEGDGVRDLQAAVWDVLASEQGFPAIVDNHGFVPHITAGYGIDIDAISYTGPVLFDRIRVAFAGEKVDIPLGEHAVTAAAGQVYRAASFNQPEPDEYVNSWRITPDGQISMHLAAWGACHIGFGGTTCVTPPEGVNEYARFHRIPVQTDAGVLRVGKITMDGSHAGTQGVSLQAAVSHYDNTGTLVAVVRCRDGVLGPWLSGHLVPWATDQQREQLAYHEVSGDWRSRPGQQLELVAALAVNHPGFMEFAASAFGEVLVAAGIESKTPKRWGYVLAAQKEQAPITADALRAEFRALMQEVADERSRDDRLHVLDRDVAPHRIAAADRRAGM